MDHDLRFSLALLLLPLVLAACGGDDAGPQDLGNLNGTIEQSPADPVCVWNQAYQENYAADSISRMVADAQGCYVLIDPFESTEARDAVGTLQAAGNTVGCYISVGTCEDWREDFADIQPFCSSTEWQEWPGEFFVDDPDGILPHMVSRIQTLASWGCDLVELDNMDFAQESETYHLGVSEVQGDAYDNALCAAAHDAGMGCMAKNYRPAGADDFDGGTFESYSYQLDWWTHDDLQSFVDAGLPAIIFHYDDRRCDDVTTYYRLRYGSGVSLLCEDPDVDGYRHP